MCSHSRQGVPVYGLIDSGADITFMGALYSIKLQLWLN